MRGIGGVHAWLPLQIPNISHDNAAVASSWRPPSLPIAPLPFPPALHSGPVWRPPKARNVLRSLPFMVGIPESLFKRVNEGGEMREVRSKEVIWETFAYQQEEGHGRKDGKAVAQPGSFVVISGVVKRTHVRPDGSKKVSIEKGTGAAIMVESGSPVLGAWQWVAGMPEEYAAPSSVPPPSEPALAVMLPWPPAAQEYFQGVGGVVGILLALTGSTLPGSEVVVAEGNGLGRGPVLFHVPQAVVAHVHKLAEGGDRAAQQVQTRMQRGAMLRKG